MTVQQKLETLTLQSGQTTLSEKQWKIKTKIQNIPPIQKKSDGSFGKTDLEKSVIFLEFSSGIETVSYRFKRVGYMIFLNLYIRSRTNYFYKRGEKQY